MAIPPLSNNQPTDFTNPYSSIESVVSNLESCLNDLVDKVNEVVTFTNKEPNAEDLKQIAKLIHTIEQCSQEADKSIGNPQTVLSVKKYIQELFHILSTPGASLLTATQEDAKHGSTDQLKSTLETFVKLSNASSRLVEELQLIAQDLHHLHGRPRHIG